MNKKNKEALYRTMGEYFNYPQCCIEYFSTNSYRGYFFNSKHVSKGSGFVPCPGCFKQTKHMNLQEFNHWLGKNPFLIKAHSVSSALARTKSKKFIDIGNKHNLNIQEYQTMLINNLK